jgi:heptosyltransferase-3
MTRPAAAGAAEAPPKSGEAKATPESGVARAWHTMVSVALAVFGFFLPFSSAGTALSLAALVLLAAARPGRVRETAPWKDPVMAMGLALFGFIALHTLLVNGVNRRSFGAINHYHELLLAPLLLALLKDARHRQILVHSLIAGAAFLAAAHWIGIYVPMLGPMLGARRISAGFALAVCAFILVMRARGRPEPWPARGLAAILAMTVLYAIEGRTGHLVLLALVSVAAWLHSPPRWRGVVTLGAFLVALALALSSGAVGNRLKENIAGASTVSRDSTITSTGIRIELMRVAADLAKTHGLAGAGYTNYGIEHERAARERYRTPVDHLNTSWMRSSNPHNEFLMHLISGGFVAFALFVSWLALSFRAAARLRPGMGGLMGGIVLAFTIGCIFNSLLLDFVEGHVYMALLAWLVAERRYACEEERRQAVMKSVLVIATRQIGDVLLTTPLVEAVRQRWPQARIEVLGFEGTLGMLKGNPAIDGFIETPARLGASGMRALARRIWRRYDLALVADPGDRAHLLGWLAAPCRSGIIPSHGSSNWLKREILDHVVVAAGDQGQAHVTAEKLSLLQPWLLHGELPVAKVVPPPAAPLPPEIDAALRPGAVVLHAPSMWPYKQWPIAHFELLVKALLAEGRQVVLTGSAGPRDQECVAPLRELASQPQLIDASGKLDFNQLVTLFGRAALYIGPDTSVSHLAASTGVPVIAIFGPTNPMRWAPWPAKAEAASLFQKVALVQHAGNVTLLQSTLHCVPCGKAGCEDHRQSRSDCLVDIGPTRVMEEARKILSCRA